MSIELKPLPEKRQSVIQEFEQILKRAVDKGASDLHLKAGLPPIVRVNGRLYYLGEDAAEKVSRLTNEQLVNFSYALMNDRQVERYENGEEVDLGYEVSGVGRFRINICQQRSNPRLVCRHIPDVIPSFEELCLPPIVSELVTVNKRGLILVTGATGSGKSTTLATMIDQIARTRSCHIVTIEDPIEFVFKDRKSIVTQREVGLDTHNFVKALKYALRQDPNVILVGEMRDQETITMALNAAETGHLVLSTLHTVDATETINRVLGSVSEGLQGAVRAQLASVLVAVISQRLLRRKDGQGRIVACEILLMNARVRDMVQDPKRTQDLLKAIEESNSEGMQSFDQSLMTLFQKDLISKEEALHNCSNIRDFQLRLGGIVSGDWREKDAEGEASRAKQIKDVLASDGTQAPIEIEGIESPKKKAG